MKLTLPREWFEREVTGGDEFSVTAGIPNMDDFISQATELRQAQCRRERSSLPFAKLINLQRRASNLSLEELAHRADIDLTELYSIEHGEDAEPEPRTVFKLAQTLHLPQDKLFQLSGLTLPTDCRIGEEAIRFAARSEPVDKLSREEHQALREFVKYLTED